MSAILAYALHHEGAFNKNSLGAVCEAARQAARLGCEAHVVVVGDASDELAAALGGYGVTKVFRARSVPEGLAQPVVDVMAQVMESGGHRYALFGGGLLGFEIGAGLAARLHAGVTMEVTQVNAVDGKLTARRPILGDTLVSLSNFKERGIIVGRLNAFEVTAPSGARAALHDVEVALSPFSSRARIVKRGEARGAQIDVEGADCLVAGGRGLGRPEGFALCEELAEALGGAVAATRAVVDAGWYPYSAQVGQTGKTVSPRLYIAAGISGAVQHKVGFQSSENIVAINNDASAPIFEYADLGIVGDLNRILPKLTAAVKARKGSIE